MATNPLAWPFAQSPARIQRRYSSRRNREPFYAVGYFTDRLFDGRVLPFPLFRASAPNAPSDFTTDGYFWRGDTIAIKWTTIDAASFNFWQTLDATSSGQGPFSSFVRVKTNVTGGLGVWTGASVSYHRLIVPKK